MVTINGKEFTDKPTHCGSCPFFHSGSTAMWTNPGKGFCELFDEFHRHYINPPKRCQKLFNAAFRFPDGENLCILYKEDPED